MHVAMTTCTAMEQYKFLGIQKIVPHPPQVCKIYGKTKHFRIAFVWSFLYFAQREPRRIAVLCTTVNLFVFLGPVPGIFMVGAVGHFTLQRRPIQIVNFSGGGGGRKEPTNQPVQGRLVVLE